jgi:hypothetical protein
MSIFSVTANENDYNIFAKGMGVIGPIINDKDIAHVICEWLNTTDLVINSHSFFSYDVSENKNIYFILDNHKKIGNPIQSRKNAVAITNFCNNSVKELKDFLDNKSYTPMIGDEPTEQEIKSYMKANDVGYYVALEELRKKKYKKL